MTIATEKTYRVGRIDTRHQTGWMPFPRPVIDDDGRVVAWVNCEQGGLADLSADDVLRRFGIDLKPREYIDLIVSRHPAAIEFVASEIRGFDRVRFVSDWDERGGAVLCELHEPDHGGQYRIHTEIPVIAVATANDVRGKVVAGNLPLHLAALCDVVYAVEFSEDPPRGRDYGVEEMREAGARLVPYRVDGVVSLPGESSSGSASSLPGEGSSSSGSVGL